MLLLRISGMEMKISNDEKKIQSQKINANINFTHPSQIVVAYFYRFCYSN